MSTVLQDEGAALIRMVMGVAVNAAKAIALEEEPAKILAQLDKIEAELRRFETTGCLVLPPPEYQARMRQHPIVLRRFAAFRELIAAALAQPEDR